MDLFVTRAASIAHDVEAAASSRAFRSAVQDFEHLLVLSDKDRGLIDAVQVIHAGSSPEGGDSAAPTTIIVDRTGTVRWVFRPDRVFRRLSPAELLAAVDEHKD